MRLKKVVSDISCLLTPINIIQLSPVADKDVSLSASMWLY